MSTLFTAQDLHAEASRTSSPTAKPARIAWLDIAKGIAILLVIAGHTVNFSPLRDVIFSFHMPLFFVLAGYTFKLRPLTTVAATSAKRLLIPYLLLAVLYYGIWNGLASSGFSLSDFVLRVVWATGYAAPEGVNAIGMAWFLMCLFMCRVIFAALQPKLDNQPLPLQGVIWLAIALLGIVLGQYAHLYLPFSLDTSLVAVFFVWCGYTARQANITRFFSSLPLFFIAFIIWLACAYFSDFEFAARAYTPFPLALLGALAGSLVIIQVSHWIERCGYVRPLSKGLEYVGVNCMLLYCFHAMDWFASWSALPMLAGLPLVGIFGTLLRIAFDLGMVVLVRQVK